MPFDEGNANCHTEDSLEFSAGYLADLLPIAGAYLVLNSISRVFLPIVNRFRQIRRSYVSFDDVCF